MDYRQEAARPATARISGLGRPAEAVNSVAAAAGGGCLCALGAGLYSKSASALPAQALRPPGALPEADFLAACVRCGLCVRDCPYDTLRLADLGDPVAAGTPYFDAAQASLRDVRGHPLRQGLPTGALDRELTDINKAQMGLRGAGRPRDLPQLPRPAL